MMFLDFDSNGYWDAGRSCKSCRQRIAPDDAIEELHFERHPVHRLEEMNGTYHAECAKPYLSLVQALNALSRGFF